MADALRIVVVGARGEAVVVVGIELNLARLLRRRNLHESRAQRRMIDVSHHLDANVSSGDWLGEFPRYLSVRHRGVALEHEAVVHVLERTVGRVADENLVLGHHLVKRVSARLGDHAGDHSGPSTVDLVPVADAVSAGAPPSAAVEHALMTRGAGHDVPPRARRDAVVIVGIHLDVAGDRLRGNLEKTRAQRRMVMPRHDLDAHVPSRDGTLEDGLHLTVRPRGVALEHESVVHVLERPLGFAGDEHLVLGHHLVKGVVARLGDDAGDGLLIARVHLVPLARPLVLRAPSTGAIDHASHAARALGVPVPDAGSQAVVVVRVHLD